MLDRAPAVLAEIRDGLEVGDKASEQPHELDVALRFALERPAGAYPVEVAVDVELEQIARIVRGAPGATGLGMGKAQRLQCKSVNERIDHPYRVIRGYIVINGFGKKRDLIARLTLNVSH